MPKRKHQKFNRPRKMFDIALIKEETGLIKQYGLKNRREVWKANFAISRIRNLAKQLITASEEEQKKFIERQVQKGFNVSTISDVLGLNKEDYLKRRLQSIVVKKGLAKTPKQARQFVTHKLITVNGNLMNSPSHLTTLAEEQTVSITKKLFEKKVISDEEKKLLANLNKSGETAENE
jgi:small subunit ribosomal protein S4